jgi:hypothetical protein
MESTPQNTQPQGQDKLVLKSTFGNETNSSGQSRGEAISTIVNEGAIYSSGQSREEALANPVAPQLSLPSEGAISDLLSHLGQVFGNTDLISAAKIELACIQEELLEKPQEVYPQLDFNDVHLRMDIQEILESCSWFEDVYIQFPKDMDVDCSGCDITVSDVEGEVEVIMSQGQSEALAEQIMDFLEKRTNIIKHA